jgi:hypothetical protein
MSAEIDITVTLDRIRGVPIPVTAVDVTPIQGPCILYGWSLREASGEIAASVSGSVTSPGATATICTTASLAAGTYTVQWEVELAGTLGVGDANNFQLVDAAGVVVGSINAAVAGVYPQGTVEVTTTVSGAILVRSNAAGTVASVYSAQLAVQPSITPAAIVEFQDGGQVLGESSMEAQGTDFETMPADGLHVSGMVKAHIVQGTVTGVLYVRFDKQS